VNKIIKKEMNSQLIPMDNSKILKGILAIMIIFHHSSLVFEFNVSGEIVHFFQDIGFILTGIFFILSGYGVRRQLEVKGRDYFKNFWKNRLKKIVVPYLILSVFCYVLRLILGGYGFDVFWTKLLLGDFPIPYSWYIIALLSEEFIFYLTYRILLIRFQLNKTLVLLLTFLLTGMLGFGFYLAGVGIWWYSSLICFPFGIILEEYEKAVAVKLKWILPSTLFVCILLGIMSENINLILYRNLMSVMTGMFIVGIFHILQFMFRFFIWLSRYSLEIYLIHGIVLFGVDSMFHNIQGEILLPMVIVLSILGSVVWNFIYNYLCGKVLKGKNNVG